MKQKVQIEPISYISSVCFEQLDEMSSFMVQSYQPGDEKEIVRLFEAAFGESDYYYPRSVSSWVWRYKQRPGFDPNSILLIRKQHTLVSALSMTYGTMKINGEDKKIALIDDVSTHPKWRKQGLATELMKYAINRAQEMDCWGVHLSADPNGSAIRVYRSIGFEEVTRCVNILSVLKHRRAARFGRRRQAIPLLALSLLDSFRSMRIDKSLCQIEIAGNTDAEDIVRRAQKEIEPYNGALILDDEYIAWMIADRSDGALKVVSITKDDELWGMFTVSSSDFSGPKTRDRMAVIGNLFLNESMKTGKAIAGALHGAKEVARKTLDCPMVNMFVDKRAENLKKMCKMAGFMEVGMSVSMLHPLGQSQRIEEARKGIWSQPVETSSSNP